MRGWLVPLLILLRGAALADVSAPRPTEAANPYGVALDDEVLGVNGAGDVAIMTRVQYRVDDGGSGQTITTCTLFVFERRGASVLIATLEQPLIVAGEVVGQRWRLEASSARSRWFLGDIAAATCDATVERLRASDTWTAARPGRALAEDWVLCRGAHAPELDDEHLLGRYSPHGLDSGFAVERGHQRLTAPKLEAVLLRRTDKPHRVLIAPAGWTLAREACK